MRRPFSLSGLADFLSGLAPGHGALQRAACTSRYPHGSNTNIHMDGQGTVKDEQTQEAEFGGLKGYRQMKTHFPSARVKKLMQSDEDIGKVAQATPLVVGRAVELFMCTLVDKALQESRKGHSKKISVLALKQAIDSNEEFDFVAEVCDKYINSDAANANATATASSSNNNNNNNGNNSSS